MVKELDIPKWAMDFRVFMARTGLTVAKVSEMTGLSFAAVSNYTRGERRPSFKSCEKIKKNIGFDMFEALYLSETRGE